MDCSLNISFSIKPVTSAHTRNVLWSLAGTLAATVIIFGGLGSIQNQCNNEDPSLLVGIDGFSGAYLGCKKLYRYYWFITALDFVTGVYGLWIAARGFLNSSRGAVLGLLVIANLLTINMTNAFLTMQSVSKWQSGVGRDRDRAMIAGCIITAVFQSFAIILVGMEPSAPSEKKKTESSEPVTKAVETAPAVELTPAAAEPATAEPAVAAPTAEADPEAPAVPAPEPAETEPVSQGGATPAVTVAVD